MKEFLQTEQDYLEQYKLRVEEKLNWGDSTNWRHQDFETLSDKILEETGVLLSSTTLKRIWGKLKYNSIPNSNTLNTLAQFIGNESWVAFRTEIEKKQSVSTPHVQTKNKKSYSDFSFLKWASIVIFLVGFILLALSLQESKRTFSEAELSKISFTSNPVTLGIPNTVIFKYDVSQIRVKEAKIQQSWDRRLQFDIDPSRKEVTSTYYFPGYFRAKLLLDDVVVKEHDLYLQSNGWIATLDREPQPRYFLEDELKKEGFLGIKNQVMTAEHLIDGEELPVLGYHYVDDFGDLSSDNFKLEASFRNTHDKGNGICQFSKIVVLCTRGAFLIPFSIPGCTGDIQLIFNDVAQSGKENDLSAFGCDFSNWQDFKLEVQNRNATLSLNDQTIYQLTYQHDAGRIVGFRFLFAGNGEVDNVRLTDVSSMLVFEDNFEYKASLYQISDMERH